MVPMSMRTNFTTPAVNSVGDDQPGEHFGYERCKPIRLHRLVREGANVSQVLAQYSRNWLIEHHLESRFPIYSFGVIELERLLKRFPTD